MVLTGWGRVGKGAKEIVTALGVKEVTAEEFLEQQFDVPVYTQLNVSEYNAMSDGSAFDRKQFYADPSGFESTLCAMQKCQTFTSLVITGTTDRPSSLRERTFVRKIGTSR